MATDLNFNALNENFQAARLPCNCRLINQYLLEA